MKKKLLLLLVLLMTAATGAWATTVTWEGRPLEGFNLNNGGSFTQDGVTLNVLNGSIIGNYWIGNSPNASFKFSTSSGNFTKIEIYATIQTLGGSGWTQTSPGAVWTGEANETTFGGNFQSVSKIVFTIEPAEPTTYTLQLVVNDPAMGSVAVTNLLGSGIVDNQDGTYTVPENAEVNLLATANEGYKFTGWREGNLNDLVGCYYCGVALNTLENTLTFTMTGDKDVLAKFAALTHAVTFAEGTPEADKWKAEPNTDVKKGETVTVTYTGERKVIGVKAEKKSAAPATKTLTLTGTYYNYNVDDNVTKSLTIEYTDNDTWSDIAGRYDEVSIQDTPLGPEGKIIYFWQDLNQGDDGCQLKSKQSTYNYWLVSINDKVSAYSSYYLGN